MTRTMLGISLLLGSLCSEQHPHTPAQPASLAGESAHHAFLEQERAAIERGEGFGMAMPADRAGYPGPKHVLELKDQLKLTPGQTSAMEKLFAEMNRKAVERGREVLLAEQRLADYFAEGRSEAELREETYRVATLRAELRWVHLGTHLAARKLLTPLQLEAYQRLRYGTSTNGHVH